MNLDLNALLPKLKADDPVAIALVRQQYGDDMLKRVFGQDREDVLQNVFLKLSQSVANCDFLTPGFLNLLVYQECCRQRRKEKRRRDKLGLVSLQKIGGKDSDSTGRSVEPESKEPRPEANAIRAELLRRMRQRLEQLPPEEREVVVLYYIECLTYREIAVRQRVSIATVCDRRKKAIVRLRRLLADGDDP